MDHFEKNKTDGNDDNKKQVCYHAGHRERMRKRFLSSTPDVFEDHELLEMLLYYVIPRQNTNETAHELIRRFHTLRGVLDASEESLKGVFGIGDNSYVAFKLFRELMRRYGAGSSETNEKFDTTEKIGKFFAEKYVGLTTEVVYVMLLDEALGFVDCKRMFEGSPNSAALDIRGLINYANANQATNIVLAHNHPNGIAVPSSDDMNTTLMLGSAFDMVGIKLVEHILVANGKYLPLVKMYSDQGLFGRFTQTAK